MHPRFCAYRSDTDPRCIVVVGDLDTHSRAQLEAELQALGTEQDIILDLSGLAFIDSGGLHLLLIHHSAHEDAGTRQTFRNPSRPFTRLMDVVDLANFFVTDST